MDSKPPTREGGAAGDNSPKPDPFPTPPVAITPKPGSVPLKPSSSPATPSAAAQQTPPPDPTSPDADLFPVPSYSRWFSWTSIHECEARLLPEFFASKSPSKTPRVYVYYRNPIIRLYLRNPSRKVTFTDARKTAVGDVGSIRRVFDFLEAWGLINYGGSGQSKALKWDDKDTGKSGGGGDGNARKRICGGCKSVCTIACFSCDKYDLTLCARCYVRGNYRVGVSSTDFRELRSVKI
ncbi:hypothetical protein MLD38_000843 [Melastoma candidum]|uniref:Uncharacterized protein n=1 Tax=Melastoma candidum TaxID=119954 RepID=A0ACB9SJZ6_9MYRT|nr:hypothetical protein MLD38_000843 [Melastoma candidum]